MMCMHDMDAQGISYIISALYRNPIPLFSPERFPIQFNVKPEIPQLT